MMLSITGSERKANQMYNEVSPHIDQNSHTENPTTTKSAEGVEKREPSYTDSGNVSQYTN